MCGICGILAHGESFDTSEPTVTSMRDTMVHRGPDDGGTWVSPDRRVALAHRRLSIVDLSSAGHQPMCNEDGTVWIVFNGEIYNHASLRPDLERKGHTYRSHTDTETILHLYEEEGEKCVERLQGMFAFAIWDARREQLFLARDRLGVKPLYFATSVGGFIFGSEIKCLLKHPSVSPDLDEQAFTQYLTFVSTPAPQTMFAGISKLAPAQRMTVRADGTVTSEIYWSPFSSSVISETLGMTEDEQEDRLLDLLRASIAKRMMSDVPFGVFLSGGVDSSTNVALMAELMSDPVKTFSVAFHEHDRYNELEYARRIARRFSTDHHEVVIDAKDLVDFLPGLIFHQDEPIADWVCVPLHYVAKLAKDRGTTVVQVGEGSDELLHGYANYIRSERLQRLLWAPLTRLPSGVRRSAGFAATRLTERLGRGLQYGNLVADAADRDLPFWGGAIAWKGDTKRSLLHGREADSASYELVSGLWNEATAAYEHADTLQKMTYLELKQRLAELLLMRVDKMTMANSVEARVPFLDHDFVEFALALPRRMKVRNGVGKYILKKSVTGLLPSDLVHRPKQGFGAPVAEWFREDLGTRAQQAIRDSTLAERRLLDYDYIDTLWERHRAGKGDWAFQLWNIYNVSAWHDYWIAGRPLDG